MDSPPHACVQEPVSLSLMGILCQGLESLGPVLHLVVSAQGPLI